METDKLQNETNQIVDLIGDLCKKIKLDKTLTSVSDEQYDKIVNEVEKLNISIYNHKLTSAKSHDRLDELTDLITSIASLDFSKRAYVGEDNNHLDYIAIGLNLLSYQLECQIKPLLWLQNTYNTTSEPIVLTNLDFEIIDVNHSTERMFGYSKSNLIHSNLLNYVVNMPPISVLTKEPESRHSIEVQNNTGIISAHNFKINAVKNKEGELCGLVFMSIDTIISNTTITDLSLKHSVDLNRIQHDIMSPVKSIQGLTELGKKTNTNTELTSLYENIDRCRLSVEMHIKDLFNLLFLNNVNTQKEELIHFHQIITHQLNDLSYLQTVANAEIKLNINNNVAFYSDKKLIMSVLHNLLSNSLKYRKINSNTTISVTVNDSNKGVYIEVKDNGIGIEPEYINDIFKPHFRATPQAEGKGLGLYILKEAILQLGGEINVESYIGVGTAFKLFLPNKGIS